METSRLILRHWRDDDAEALYKYAKSKSIGPAAGWNPHKDVEESLMIIREIFSKPETYAIVLKETMEPVGCIALMPQSDSNIKFSSPYDMELGYWIGTPYWGRGLVPEAAKALIRRGFEELGCKNIWCGYFDGNNKSRRVQEKLGFSHVRTEQDIFWETTCEIKTEHVNILTRESWEERQKSL